MTTEEQLPATASRFGDYELLRYFTAGGMADLYLAKNRRFGDRQLILKRIQSRYLGHSRVVKMFIDEGRIARLLEHPNVVRVLDVGQADGNWYIAMEHIQGHDLVALARRSAEADLRIPRPVAVGVLTQVAAGLAYAHSRTDDGGRSLRIIHCDVSPGNVVIAFSGVAKIVDFGIARATIAAREEGGVAGKYNYMAPEQVRGERFDARADLFPLGVMLHELTVGRRLFRGRPEVVMRRVCEDPIPLPSDLAPGYPPALERIVMRLLERDPAARYPSAAQALEDLRAYLREGEDGWDSPAIARYLRSLFTAPRQETTDPSVIVEDMEVDRGMPDAGPDAVGEVLPSELLAGPPADEPRDTPREVSFPELIPGAAEAGTPTPTARHPVARGDDGPTAAIVLPDVTPKRTRAPAAAVEATEMVRLPEARRPRGKGGKRPRSTAGAKTSRPQPAGPARRPGPGDATMLVKTPESRRLASRPPISLSTGLVVGGSMLMVAIALFIAWLIAGR